MPQIGGGGGTPDAHKTSHQNGGSDEISLAGLSGALADAQTPAAHKATHQDAGTDEIDATGLAGRINLVDRGDPAAQDFDTGAFTTDAAWHDLDLSSIVPAGAYAAHIKVTINHVTAGSIITFRKKGNSNSVNVFAVNTHNSGVASRSDGIVYLDANRVIEYQTTGTAFTTIALAVRGWFI